MQKTSLFLLIWFIALLGACDFISEKPVEMAGSALGTTYSVKIIGLPENISSGQLHEELKKVIAEVDLSMSVHNAASEISKFNQSSELVDFKVSPDLLNVIKEALEISRLSNGAFDVTIGNLIELWGFGKTISPERVPLQEEIKQSLSNSGYKKFQISLDNSSIRKTIPKLTINLSAIAKGFAVDSVAKFLDQKGVHRYLVEIGGEIRTKGLKQNNKPWLVAIERPDIDKRSIYKVIRLSDLSMATSGDYRNFYEIEGQRYSHTINPFTGRPVENNIASVSVIHSSCMSADALATTLMSLGYEKGNRFASEHSLSVLWILRTEKGVIEKASDAFDLNLFQ